MLSRMLTDLFGNGPMRGIVVVGILFFSLMVKVRAQEARDRSFGHDEPEPKTADEGDEVQECSR